MIFRYLVFTFGAVLATAALLRLTVLSTYVMSGGAMAPRILPGEYLLATRGDLTRPPRGAVMVLRCPGASPHVCLRRVAAVGGDRIDVAEGRIMVNDRALDPPLSRHGELELPLVVPPDQVFVRNEDDADPDDSRAWGPVDVGSVEARVRFIWLSLDWFDPAGEVRDWPRVRWERLFRAVD